MDSKRSRWDCWNLRFCRELRRQPLALAAAGVGIVLSGLLAGMAASMWAHMVSVGNAPGEIKSINKSLKNIEESQQEAKEVSQKTMKDHELFRQQFVHIEERMDDLINILRPR